MSFGLTLRGLYSTLIKPTVTFFHLPAAQVNLHLTCWLHTDHNIRTYLPFTFALQAHLLYIYYLYNICSLNPFIRPPPHTNTVQSSEPSCTPDVSYLRAKDRKAAERSFFKCDCCRKICSSSQMERAVCGRYYTAIASYVFRGPPVHYLQKEGEMKDLQ